MLRKEQNELLTRTGQGTPMDENVPALLIPALLPEELPENDDPPIRVRLLSERLIAFRDTEGRFGLMDEFCAHRGVSYGSAAMRNAGFASQFAPRRCRWISSVIAGDSAAAARCFVVKRNNPAAGTE